MAPWVLLLLLAVADFARAQDFDQAPLDVTGSAETSKSSAPSASPLDASVELDQLLRLPSSMDFEQQHCNKRARRTAHLGTMEKLYLGDKAQPHRSR